MDRWLLNTSISGKTAHAATAIAMVFERFIPDRAHKITRGCVRRSRAGILPRRRLAQGPMEELYGVKTVLSLSHLTASVVLLTTLLTRKLIESGVADQQANLTIRVYGTHLHHIHLYIQRGHCHTHSPA